MAMMRQKLLYKTLRPYVLLSVVILLLTAPAFYFIARYLHVEEADEALLVRKHEFTTLQLPAFTQAQIVQWNKWNTDTKIEPADNTLTADSYAFADYLNIMDKDMEPYRVLRSSIAIQGKPYTLVARISLLQMEETVLSIVGIYILLVVLLLVTMFVFTRRLSLTLWQPFYSLLNQLEKFELHSPAPLRIPDTEVEEFYNLNTAIETLIARNVAIYKSQKEFVENAAHELQTPLAIMQGRLDNMIQQQQLSATQAQALEELQQSLSRLNKLNKNLLLLSRIDAQTAIEKIPIPASGILHALLDSLADQLAYKNITVTAHLAEGITIKGNQLLFETLLNNLLINAIYHNRQGGSLTISLSLHQLTISNTGASAPLDTNKLFERFSKINPSGGGTGLGLAIANKIAALHGWQLSYTYKEGQHIFLVAF
jgi:signal transduction histidine kinase